MTDRRMLVVGAHSADFVWRAAGAIAKHVHRGGEARVVALSYGERGESGELWKQEGQTLDNVKRIRYEEAAKAAAAVGAAFDCFDLGDYPLEVDAAARDRLVQLLQEFAPQVVLTHPARDPFNPDHPVAHEATVKARLLSTGAVVASAFRTAPPSQLLAFEPHQPEHCEFLPTTFVDITDVMEQKTDAMEAMAAQRYLHQYYTERAGHRGNHARKVTGDDAVRYAEAFQRLTPHLVEAL